VSDLKIIHFLYILSVSSQANGGVHLYVNVML